MPAFMITFGTRWAHEVHPAFPAAHPEGWLTVLARDAVHARKTVTDLLGVEYSWIHPEIEFQPRGFPRGQLGVIDAMKPARPEWSTVAIATLLADAVLRLQEVEHLDAPARFLDSLEALLTAIIPMLPNPAIEEHALQLASDLQDMLPPAADVPDSSLLASIQAMVERQRDIKTYGGLPVTVYPAPAEAQP